MLVKICKYCIECYWRKVSASKRRVCIHKVSCSNAVYDSLSNYGFWVGIKTYLQRRKTCNEGYSINKIDEKIVIKTKAGYLLQENEINPIIVKEFNNSTFVNMMG